MRRDFHVFDKRTNDYAKALRIDFETGQAAIMAKNTSTVYMSGEEPNPIGSLRKLSDISLDIEVRYPTVVYVVEIYGEQFDEYYSYASGVYVAQESAKGSLIADGFNFDTDTGEWVDKDGTKATITAMKLEE